MLFYRFRKKRTITGQDEKGELFNMEILKNEEVSEDAFLELSNGRGEEDVKQ